MENRALNSTMQTNILIISRHNDALEMIPMQAWRKQNCIGRAYRYKYVYLSANVSVYVEARGVWGHAPLGRIF